MPTCPSSVQIKKLYKEILRYGQNLQHTDRNYFYRRIKSEFKANKSLTEEEKISFSYNRGLSLLNKKSLV